MPSKHKGHPTIAFRPDSEWQYNLINKRAELSGMHKKDFIARCCIYSNICVVGTKENISIIVSALKDMQVTMLEVAKDIEACNIPLSEDGYLELKQDFLALVLTAVEIINGAAYLFDQMPNVDYNDRKKSLELDQFKAEWLYPITSNKK